MQTTEHIKLPAGSLEKQTTTLNLGPTHPATHGVFQNILELDGERIVDAVQTVGYIHRAFEKIAERRPLYQITPLTDRMNYCSSPINNMGWHITCERLLKPKILIASKTFEQFSSEPLKKISMSFVVR